MAPRRALRAVLGCVALAGCADAAGGEATATAPSAVPAPTSADPAPATTTTTTTVPTTTTTAAPVRHVGEQAWTPFATVGDVVLQHPSARIERVGLHESNHDGAQQLAELPTAVSPVVLETRDRGTGSRTAADIVADPAVEVRAPVTGTVLRAGGYTLYCVNEDEYVVIEPDARPGWEVKLLHIVGVPVRAGDRVVAGETVVARGPRPLPFVSQVDELRTVDPAWPHVHLEVVDPTIPDRPSPGGGC